MRISRFRVSLPPPVTDPSAPGFLPAAEEYVRCVRNGYDARAHGHRLSYRISGIIVIVAGASLPLLTTLNFPQKNLTISLAGILVAAVTALRGFYRWDQMWVLLRHTDFAVTAAYWKWRVAVGDNVNSTRKRDAARLHKATVEMLDKVDDIRQTEAASFFKDLPFPHNA
jgi:hypothetical protein